MAKLYDVAVKTGSYTDGQGAEKGRYTKLGVVMSGNDGGQFMLLEPMVDIAGCLMLQNNMAITRGQPVRDSLMCTMFEPNQQGQAKCTAYGTNQPQQQQQAPQQQQQQPMQQQAQPQQQMQQQNVNAGFNNDPAPF
jgi:outer membrane protein OmpA-like peptidoglycan-associated protein